MVFRRVLDYVISQTGARLIPAGYAAFKKYDVRITNQLFGKSGGKGFRHGRDIGLIASEFIGDELDTVQKQPPRIPFTPRKYTQARGRDQRRRNRCRCKPNRYYKYN